MGAGSWLLGSSSTSYLGSFNYLVLLGKMEIIVNIIFLFLAVIFNDVMDKTETLISFNASIFSKFNPNFWCKAVSAQRPFIPYTKYRVDAWHLSKSAMICCFCAAMAHNFWEFALYGFVWNFIFVPLYKNT